MIGICSESFVWINHFLFTISRMRPKFNLKRLIMKNRYLKKGKDFEIQPRRIEFRMKGTGKRGSLFINILIKKMIIEWYFILFLSCFIYVISEVRVNYNKYTRICMFILLFFISYLMKWKYKGHSFNNYFYFNLACVDIGVSTPAQLDEAMKGCIGLTSGTGIFRKYYYIILYLIHSIHHFIYIFILFPSSPFS
jgi:hypothetical protein